MKTAQRILNQAIKSYNRYGLPNVTSRDLAKSLGISHGNLEYHFPNKESILLGIYAQMKDEISKYYLGENRDILSPIAHFHKLLIRLDEFQNEYSFFCTDIMEICRKYKKVNQDLENNLRIRKTQMAGFFQKFVEFGFMKPEPAKDYYERLQHTIRIMLMFWLTQENVITNFTFKGKGEMVKHIWELLTPHFTDKGQLEYEKVIREHNFIINQSI